MYVEKGKKKENIGTVCSAEWHSRYSRPLVQSEYRAVTVASLSRISRDTLARFLMYNRFFFYL